jgi:hypothetical protein
MSAFFFSVLVLSAGFSPSFLPPAGGIGVEARFPGARAYAMGGAAAGIPDSCTVSMSNPAASGWAPVTGLTWGVAGISGDDRNWTGKLGFPHVSLVFPIPWGITLSGSVSSRSRLSADTAFTFEGGQGTGHWSGGLTEGWAGVTVRAGNSLAFSLGSRSTFGNIMGEFITNPDSLPGPEVPLSTQYRDDVVFTPSAGLLFGAFLNTGPFNAGLSITTDRRGDLEIHRDCVGATSADTTLRYSIPGDLAAGVSVRPVQRLLLAADLYQRKKLSLLDAESREGSIYSGGAEYTAAPGLSLRAGVSRTSGLWRDGAIRYTAGAGYSFGGGRATLDVSAGWETWGDDLSETTVYATLWASENWLE